jgi:hypothetical protein
MVFGLLFSVLIFCFILCIFIVLYWFVENCCCVFVVCKSCSLYARCNFYFCCSSLLRVKWWFPSSFVHWMVCCLVGVIVVCCVCDDDDDCRYRLCVARCINFSLDLTSGLDRRWRDTTIKSLLHQNNISILWYSLSTTFVVLVWQSAADSVCDETIFQCVELHISLLMSD